MEDKTPIDPDLKHLWIEGLTQGTKANQIKELLKSYGNVTNGKVVQKGSINKGNLQVFSFISFSAAEG